MKDEIKSRASLSWSKEDYYKLAEEPPECLSFGKTEGEFLEDEALENWLAEELQSLNVFQDDYPEKFEEHYRYYILDLEYLYLIGKITEEELQELKNKGNFTFGKK